MLFGQFIRHREVKSPDKYVQKAFSTQDVPDAPVVTKELSSLADHLKSRLVAILGPDYYTFPPYVYRPNFGKSRSEAS